MIVRKKWIPAIVTGVLVLWLANGLRAADSPKRTGPPDQAEVMRSLELFTRVFEKINTYYVDEDIDPNELVRKAIEGMLQSLDPHSQFLDNRMYDDLMTSTQGSFGGLGIELSVRDNYPTVVSPMEGTPAYTQGIQGGDQIIEIEGEDTYKWPISKAVSKLRGPQGTEVHFKVKREGAEQPIDFAITRAIIEIESVRYAMKIGDVGYIRVINFAQDTAEELEKRVAALESQGIKGLVLDMRYNPGGLLRSAREVSQLFLDSGKKIVYTRGRTPRQNADYYSTTPENKVRAKSYPIALLINGGSASASEIVAGALQDWDAAVIIGETSFGKGSVQTVYPLSETEALKLTTAKYYTPSGRCIHKEHPKEDEQAAAEDEENPDRQQSDRPDAVKPDGSKPAVGKPEGSKPDAGKLDAKKSEAPQPAETFRTVGGRKVTGGGGIVPDIVIRQPDPTQFAIDLERKNYFFQYAIKYVARHPQMHEFKQMLADDKFTYDPKAWDDNKDYVQLGIRREVARRLHGSKAAYLVSIEGDEQLKRALDIFQHGHTMKEFFALTGDDLKAVPTEEIKKRMHTEAATTR